MRLSAVVAFVAASSLAAAPVAAQVRPASSVPAKVVKVDRTGAQLENENAFLDEPLGAMHYVGALVILLGLGYLVYSLLKKDDPESPEGNTSAEELS